ncbi:MAG: hypothetical protein ACI9BF_000199 [Candidatus Paceibacteria bacterium]|jgi:hypothetical protein
MYDWETFQAAYQNASAEDMAVVDSDTIPVCVREVIESKKLDVSHYANLVKLSSLFILKAIPEQTLIDEVEKLGISGSKILFYSLQICLEENKTAKNIPSGEADEAEDLTSDIAEAEAIINNLSSVRTMAKDMQESKAISDTTHSSTQEAILSKKVSAPSQTNHWESAEN